MLGRELDWLLPKASEGHVVGYRSWFASEEGQLFSWAIYYRWPLRSPARGNLDSPRQYNSHPAGIYASKSRGDVAMCPGELANYHREPVHSMTRGPLWLENVTLVVGTVALWGDVAEHDLGWRATHAYPLSVNVRGYEELGERLRRNYDVWVED